MGRFNLIRGVSIDERVLAVLFTLLGAIGIWMAVAPVKNYFESLGITGLRQFLLGITLVVVSGYAIAKLGLKRWRS